MTARKLPKVKNLIQRTTPEFRRKLYQVAIDVGIPPGELASLMGFESSWTWSPSVRNPSGGATGLIQFMPSTAKMLGTTTDQLAAMSAVQQLDYVKAYLARMPKWRMPGDAYLQVFWPAGVGKPDSFLIGEKDSTELVPNAKFTRGRVYAQNSGLDGNRDGRITAGDVRARVLSILRTSEAAGWVEIEEEQEMDASLIEAFAKALGVAVEAIVAALQSQQLELRRVAAPDATKAMHDARNDALSGGK